MGGGRPIRDSAAVVVAVIALAALAAPSAAVPLGPSSPTAYCRPANTFYNPVDVPPEGSARIPTRGVRSRRIRIEGVSTRLLESGPRRPREAVVFLHGNPGSAQDWLDLIPRVARAGIRTVAFDLPGYGHAAKPFGFDYTLGGYARYLNRTLGRLGIRRAHLVLHDISGGFALGWASQRPERLESAVVINTGILVGYEHHELAEIWRTPELGESFWLGMNREAWFLGLQNGQQERPLPRSFADRLYDDLDRRTRCGILDLYRSFPPNEGIDRPARRVALRLRRHDPARPALVVWGARDPYVPVRLARAQRLGFPRAQIRIFQDSGHWPFADDPRRTRRHVVPFLRAQFRQR